METAKMAELSDNSGSKKDITLRQVMDELRAAYADAIIPNMTHAQFMEAEPKRLLMWKASQRLSLADAVKCYDQMAGSYNEFRPALLRKLHKAFPDAGIEATAAREMSVAVYLHVPDRGDLRSQVETFARERFNADTVEWTERGTLHCWWD